MQAARNQIDVLTALLASAALAANAEWQAPTNTTGLPLKTYSALVVDCGQDCFRKYDGRPMLNTLLTVNAKRVAHEPGTDLWSMESALQADLNADIDDDGANDDDAVSYLPFSLTERFNPAMPWYDRRAASARWFGGLVMAQGDRRVPPGFGEIGVNDETVIPKMAPRDNWTFFHEIFDVNGPYYFYGIWLWKKEDFLAGGETGKVSFDSESFLALYMQRYWMGFDGLRWVVQDGDQLYLSEKTFSGAGQQPYSTNGKQQRLTPTATRWAVYNPKAPYAIRWIVDTDAFTDHIFTNVQAVGFYLFKDRFIPAYTGFKWYAFEARAAVTRPDRPSLSLDMALSEDTDDVPAFYISRSEIPYILWKDVFRRARSNTFVYGRGSTFDRDGDMGSMDLDYETHGLEEPVTDITVPDILAWCNALSREEGFTPCYYTDAAFTDLFREAIPPPHIENPPTSSVVYVKWEADGYRLPTSDEWTLAAIGSPASGLPSHVSTVGVDADIADANGLYHLHDNVREMVWIWGDCYDSSVAGSPIALGGDFRSGSSADYGASGFRVVRREAGLSAPSVRDDATFDLVEVVPLSASALDAPPSLVMLDAFVRPNQAKRQKHLASFDTELGLVEARVRKCQIRYAMGDDVHFCVRDKVGVAQDFCALACHHHQPIATRDQFAHDRSLRGAGVFQDGVQRGYHGHARLFQQRQQMAAGRTAIDAELVLHA